MLIYHLTWGFLKDKHEHLQKRHDNLRDYLKKKLSRMKLGCYMSWFRYFIPQTNETYNPSKCLQFDTLPSTLPRHLLIAWNQQPELRKQIPSDNRCLLIKDLIKVRKHFVLNWKVPSADTRIVKTEILKGKRANVVNIFSDTSEASKTYIFKV